MLLLQVLALISLSLRINMQLSSNMVIPLSVYNSDTYFHIATWITNSNAHISVSQTLLHTHFEGRQTGQL